MNDAGILEEHLHGRDSLPILTVDVDSSAEDMKQAIKTWLIQIVRPNETVNIQHLPDGRLRFLISGTCVICDESLVFTVDQME